MKSWFFQVCRVAEPPSPWAGQGPPRSRSSVVRSYSTGQQEPRPYSPPTLPNNTSLLSSLQHQPDNSTSLLQDGSLEEDRSVEEDNLGQQDKMDIEVSPPSPSPPTSRWSQLLTKLNTSHVQGMESRRGLNNVSFTASWDCPQELQVQLFLLKKRFKAKISGLQLVSSRSAWRRCAEASASLSANSMTPCSSTLSRSVWKVSHKQNPWQHRV